MKGVKGREKKKKRKTREGQNLFFFFVCVVSAASPSLSWTQWSLFALSQWAGSLSRYLSLSLSLPSIPSCGSLSSLGVVLRIVGARQTPCVFTKLKQQTQLSPLRTTA